ncbi:MAG TPA: lytic transglycosylase domain-containing protein [Dongiaceae bacterium]|nr:lytic transglycosylase domain-containing protein [Dongiaceae bacterium]
MRRFLILLSAFCFISLTAQAGALSKGDADRLRRCFVLVDKDQWTEALKLAKGIRSPAAQKLLRWLDLLRPGHSWAEITEFLAANPTWPRRDGLLAQAERVLPDNMAAPAIIAWFHGRDPLTAVGGQRLAAALEESGIDPAPLLRRLWVTKNFDLAAQNEFLSRWAGRLRHEDHARRVERLMWDHDDEQSAQQIAQMHDVLGPAQSEAVLVRHKLQIGDIDGPGLYGTLPDEAKHDSGILYDLARFYRRHDDLDAAYRTLAAATIAPEREDEYWGEIDLVARALYDRHDAQRAYTLVRKLDHAQGVTYVDSEFLAGWLALRGLGDPHTAAIHFMNIVSRATLSLSRARGAYWTALALEESGAAQQAEQYWQMAASDPLAFYGQLAQQRQAQGHIALAITPAKAESGIANSELTTIVRILNQIDRPDLAKTFLARMMQNIHDVAEAATVAKLAQEAGGEQLGLYAAKEARKQGFDLPGPLFPLRTLPSPREIEPALALGIIRQESAFNPEARSVSGALGMMQLLPSTAKGVARELRVSFQQPRLTSDPNYNMRLGQHYLGSLIQNFQGSYVLAIAAYNAGPSRVKEWIAAHGDPRRSEIDVIDWIETIPVEQTRNYVERVLENTQVYRARLNSNRAPLMLQKDLRRTLQADVNE